MDNYGVNKKKFSHFLFEFVSVCELKLKKKMLSDLTTIYQVNLLGSSWMGVEMFSGSIFRLMGCNGSIPERLHQFEVQLWFGSKIELIRRRKLWQRYNNGLALQNCCALSRRKKKSEKEEEEKKKILFV